MWGTQNDNFSGVGAGGFVEGGNAQFGSPGGGGDKPKTTRRSNNIVPVTVKQLLECQEDNVTVEGTEATVVTIVGLVAAVDQTTTKLTIHVDDQTGVIACINYAGADTGNSADVPFVPMEGTYGRVVGALRSMKGGKYLVIFKFLPLTDLNEMTAHILEVIQVAMKLKKLRETEAQKTGVGVPGTLNNTLNLNNSMVVGNFGGSGALGMMGGSGNAGGTSGVAAKSAFNSIQKTVLNIIQSNKSESGIHKDDIMRTIQGSITMKELEKLLEDLGGEGHIYSTVDDDHFKTTD